MSDLRKLMAGYVDEGKRKEIQSKLDHFEIRDLGDVGPVRSLATLLGVCKSVIELLYFKGFTQKEASEELDIPLGTIKTKNRTCIGELRTMLGV